MKLEKYVAMPVADEWCVVFFREGERTKTDRDTTRSCIRSILSNVPTFTGATRRTMKRRLDDFFFAAFDRGYIPTQISFSMREGKWLIRSCLYVSHEKAFVVDSGEMPDATHAMSIIIKKIKHALLVERKESNG